jgi:hypothetical protein
MSYSGYGWDLDAQHFGLRVEANFHIYKLSDGSTPEIEQVGTLGGHTLKVIIAEGTIATSNGARLNKLAVDILPNGKLRIGLESNMAFSHPVSIFEMVDGDWVELVTFTQLVNGETL